MNHLEKIESFLAALPVIAGTVMITASLVLTATLPVINSDTYESPSKLRVAVRKCLDIPGNSATVDTIWEENGEVKIPVAWKLYCEEK